VVKQELLSDLRRGGYAGGMAIPANRIRRVIFCVAWFNVAGGGPLEAISALRGCLKS
jgi:hypothetical protein